MLIVIRVAYWSTRHWQSSGPLNFSLISFAGGDWIAVIVLLSICFKVFVNFLNFCRQGFWLWMLHISSKLEVILSFQSRFVSYKYFILNFKVYETWFFETIRSLYPETCACLLNLIWLFVFRLIALTPLFLRRLYSRVKLRNCNRSSSGPWNRSLLNLSSVTMHVSVVSTECQRSRKLQHKSLDYMFA